MSAVSAPKAQFKSLEGLRNHAKDIVASVSLALLASQSVSMLTSKTGIVVHAIEIASLYFLTFAVCYGGSLSTYWGFLAPVSLFFLFAPLMKWESLALVEGFALTKLAFAPSLSFAAGSAFAISRGTKTDAFAATLELAQLESRHLIAIKDLKSLEMDMKDILQALEEHSLIDSHHTDAVADGQLATHAQPPIDALGHGAICTILRAEVERLRQLGRKGLQISFETPLDVPFPLAVRGQRDILESEVRAILAQAVGALGGNSRGVIRIVLRPGLRSVTLSVEDNGRGLHEDMIHSLESKGLTPRLEGSMKLADIRRVAYNAGWKMEVQTRLGVGTRMVIEMPRVDAFAYGARATARKASNLSDSTIKRADQDSRHA